MNLDNYSFEELFGAIGRKLDKTNFVKFSITTNEIPSDPPVVEIPEEEEVKPSLTSDYKYFKKADFVKTIKVNDSTEDLFVVTFDDGNSRLYSVNKEGKVSNRGFNILDANNLVLYGYNIIDQKTGSNGLDPDPFAPLL